MHLLIIRNGGAAVSAVRTLRALDWGGEITIVSRESVPHYSPIFLPYYIEGRISKPALYYRGKHFYADNGVRFIPGEAVIGVDTAGKNVVLESGECIPYDWLLIATGASPVRPSIPGANGKDVLVLRTLTDADRILSLDPRRTAIVGTGPVAIELAIALSRSSREVTLIGRSRIMRRIFAPDVSEKIAELLVAHGIEVLLGQQGIAIESGCVVTAEHTIDCDAVVLAAGVRPNTDFLAGTEIELGDKGGIVVDSHMHTSVPGIYAAGDCVQAPDFLTGEPALNAIWPEAIDQGKIAALSISGIAASYRGGIPRNVINVFEIPALSAGYHIGETHVRGFPGGWITVYKQDGRIVGVETIGEQRSYGYLPVFYKCSVYTDWLRQVAFKLCTSIPQSCFSRKLT